MGLDALAADVADLRRLVASLTKARAPSSEEIAFARERCHALREALSETTGTRAVLLRAQISSIVGALDMLQGVQEPQASAGGLTDANRLIDETLTLAEHAVGVLEGQTGMIARLGDRLGSLGMTLGIGRKTLTSLVKLEANATVLMVILLCAIVVIFLFLRR
ncbi:Qb-SNARE 2 [Giardia muris]|uniref:Qb-SNARE 2 n=1 Tax=Giardia muris TaxID=5742 RepID=A0A4Z1T201_GIAMU|nr:Qb-SNARE 2 [Giardia muris]TNJ29364.1 Qb-SNARE 2 [Giardia muris]|eukprot:TNJ26431.1 Qb-SNARE 2 [Giardia muris]